MVFLEWVNRIIHGDALQVLKKIPKDSVDMVMTSPPYWGLRNYGADACKVWDGKPGCRHEWVEGSVYYDKPRHGMNSVTMGVSSVAGEASSGPAPESMFCHKCGAWYGQLGLEPSPEMYVKHLLEIFREVRRVLKPTGSFYLNMGDTYAGSNCGSHDHREKSKNFNGRKQYGSKYGKAASQAGVSIPRKSLCMVPERVALVMVDEGWILRNKIIWHKPNPMPSPVKDRLNNTWEYLFHFVKKQRYYYDLDAIREPHKTASLERTRRKWDGHREPGTSWQGMDISKMCHPKGKNPGDFVSTRKRDKIDSQKTMRMRSAPEPGEKNAFNPKGKNPGDFVKHDVAVGRIGNFSYSDPLHTRAYNPDGKNPGDVFEITTKPFHGAHFAVYPEELCIKPIKSSCPLDGIVLDPFCGAGTTCLVAKKLGRNFIGIEINEKYCEMARKRLNHR